MHLPELLPTDDNVAKATPTEQWAHFLLNAERDFQFKLVGRRGRPRD
jgi:hypothetical protein